MSAPDGKQSFLARCTSRQNRLGQHGKAQYGGPCSKRVERCIQCVIDQAVEDQTALESQLTVLRGALERLVVKLDAIAVDPSHLGIIALAHAHGVRYTGPNWAEELTAAKAALAVSRVLRQHGTKEADQ